MFLEGNDDERFFSQVMFSLLAAEYPEIRVIPYAQDPPKETNKFLRTISSSEDEYIFVKDINDAPCITASKAKTAGKYKVNQDNVVIVVKEIECWYLCGLDNDSCRRLRMERHTGNTDNMTKEDFDNFIPEDISRIEFMQQILERFDIEIGKQRNRSFHYFLRKWVE